MSGPDGLLANTARPLAGLDKRTRWLPAENVAYGNMSAAKKETLTVGTRPHLANNTAPAAVLYPSKWCN